MSTPSIDKRWMRLALSLGERGMGQTWPNPSVGCVLVRKNRVLGRGYTQQGGRPHAEIMALTEAGDARCATAYVTLEPCSHTGKTPPCARALIDAGVTRVVVATTDPDPRVSGRGIQMLRDAGIEVVEDILKEDADQAHAGFFSRIQHNKPFVTLKLAISLDGRIATQTGDSQWITGEQSRRFVHYLRATHDAVMVGSGTAVADDPSLNVRGFGTTMRQPVRVVLDSTLRTPATGMLGTTANQTPVWMCHGTDADFGAWKETSAISLPCNISDGTLDLNAVMTALADRGLTRVFCEGGGTLAASLIKAGLVDQLILMQAGVAIGSDGTPSLGAMGIDILADAPRLTLTDQRRIGDDTVSTWIKP